MVNFRNIQKSWKLRIRKTGMYDEDFARLLNINPQALSALINVRAHASLERIQAIEDLLAEHGQPFKPEYIEDAPK